MKSWLLAFILLSCLALAGCSASRTSVPVSLRLPGFTPGLSAPRILAHTPSAKKGKLTPGKKDQTALALFSFSEAEPLFADLLPLGVSLEVMLDSGTTTVESLSLFILDEAALQQWRKNGASPNLAEARIENASGTVGIAQGLSGNRIPAGFAVRVTAAAETRITGISFVNETTGWVRGTDHFWAGFSPTGGRRDASAKTQDMPVDLLADSSFELTINAVENIGTPLGQERFLFLAGSSRFSLRKSPSAASHIVPGFLISAKPAIVTLAQDGAEIAGMRVVPNRTAALGDILPIRADPHMIVEWPQSRWRKKERELFAWDRFPSVLIMDTATYEIQDRYFKRLAFFVEKKGFTGTLWTDEQLSGLHAYNAHDYKAESLAAFYSKAAESGFSLNPEELELRDILLSARIIEADGTGYKGGHGAILSFSRSSPSYLRYLLIAHEGFHGLYFISPEFRQKVSEVYAALSPQARDFLVDYFTAVDSLGYDTADNYLMENEFMAYLLQQGPDSVGPYFSGTLAERYARYGGDSRLASYVKQTGARDFAAAAAELNDFIFTRWGLSGGRIGLFSGN